ncbi:hypothetical protein C8F01DRAFT_1128577 [Mycena amicta]|nr:hypothetical protein C8F01DRAFT_1128577 [Mycena amicta]
MASNSGIAASIAALVLESLTPVLLAQNASLEKKIDDMHATLQTALSEVADSRTESRDSIRLIGDIIKCSHNMHALRIQRAETLLGINKTYRPHGTSGSEEASPTPPSDDALPAESNPSGGDRNEQTLVADENISTPQTPKLMLETPTMSTSLIPVNWDSHEASPSRAFSRELSPLGTTISGLNNAHYRTSTPYGPRSARPMTPRHFTSPPSTPGGPSRHSFAVQARGHAHRHDSNAGGNIPPGSPSADSIDEQMVHDLMYKGAIPSSNPSSPVGPRTPVADDVYLSNPPSPPLPRASTEDLFDGQLSPLPANYPLESSDSEDEVPLLKQERVDPPVSRPTRKRKRPTATLRPAGTTPKQPTKRARKVKTEKTEGAIWPDLTTQFIEHDGKFIQCHREIKCGRWYHYCCAGIVPGDRRTANGGTRWLCPFCVAKSGLPPVPRTPGGTVQPCSRPNCPVVGEYFEPVGIFGRLMKNDASKGRIACWLVFWKGYQWDDASWEPEPPSADARDEFFRRAQAEGLDIDEDVDLVMLQAAVQGGVKNPLMDT